MGKFLAGFWMGIMLTILTTTYKVTSHAPEWKLVTDGKTIDTLYIYKK